MANSGESTDKKGIISALTPVVGMLEGGAAQTEIETIN